jgi:hypothetical protein
MISYHKNLSMNPAHYASNWKTVDTNDLERLVEGVLTYPWSPIVWKDGKRTSENFLCADFLAYDFDDGRMSLKTCVSKFENHIHIIGTTKSHQKEKGGKPAVDRFRLILRLTERITSAKSYMYNIEKFAEDNLLPCDMSTFDPARFFFPCADIESWGGTPLLMQYWVPVKEVPDDYFTESLSGPEYQELVKFNTAKFKGDGYIPPHIAKFLEVGAFFSHGRQTSCFITAIFFLERGYAPGEIFEKIEKSPFPRIEFADAEITHAIDQAIKFVERKLNHV